MSDASATANPVEHVYAIGIGSNRPLSRAFGPRAIVEAAFDALDAAPLRLLARSPVIATRPLGPSMRVYANAAALLSSPLPPLAMLDHLQEIERTFGRRRYRRWGARTLDLDLLLWSGGTVRSKRLTIPHSAFRERAFVLIPLKAIVPQWKDPASGYTINQLAAQAAKAQAAEALEI